MGTAAAGDSPTTPLRGLHPQLRDSPLAVHISDCSLTVGVANAEECIQNTSAEVLNPCQCKHTSRPSRAARPAMECPTCPALLPASCLFRHSSSPSSPAPAAAQPCQDPSRCSSSCAKQPALTPSLHVPTQAVLLLPLVAVAVSGVSDSSCCTCCCNCHAAAISRYTVPASWLCPVLLLTFSFYSPCCGGSRHTSCAASSGLSCAAMMAGSLAGH